MLAVDEVESRISIDVPTVDASPCQVGTGEVRAEAVRLLGRFDDRAQAALPVILAAVDDSSNEVRAAAVARYWRCCLRLRVNNNTWTIINVTA